LVLKINFQFKRVEHKQCIMTVLLQGALPSPNSAQATLTFGIFFADAFLEIEKT